MSVALSELLYIRVRGPLFAMGQLFEFYRVCSSLVLETTDMPVCCRCNGSGRCMSCSCVKSGRPCVDCLPSREGHCCNNAPTPTPTPTSTADEGHCPSPSPSVDTSATVNCDNVLKS